MTFPGKAGPQLNGICRIFRRCRHRRHGHPLRRACCQSIRSGRCGRPMQMQTQMQMWLQMPMQMRCCGH
jgi:hypothetical protein